MLGDVQVFALLTFVISATLAQLQPQGSVNGEPRHDRGYDGSHFGSVVLCSEAGNCTCVFEKFRVIVKCTSVGDKLGELAYEFPQTTSHL